MASFRRAVRALAVSFALVGVMGPTALWGEGLSAGTTPRKKAFLQSPVSAGLRQVVAATDPLAAAESSGYRVHEGRIHVHVRCESAGVAGAVVGILRREGASGILERDVRVEAWVLPGSIGSLATLPGVVRVDRPDYVSNPPDPLPSLMEKSPSRFRAGTYLTEGLAAMNGPAWQASGISGQGKVVGVIDSFAGYEALVGVELPPLGRLEFQQFGGGPRSDSAHGTACAEIIYDIAPGIEKMYLYEANTGLEVQAAIESLQSKGVRVISASFGWPGQTAMDGTGFMQAPLAAYKNAGGLYVQSAANDRNFTWWGRFVDADADGWADLQNSSGGVDEINRVMRDDGSVANYPVGQKLTARLTWNQWTAPETDLDLYVYFYDVAQSKWVQVAASEDPQTGLTSQWPYESITYTIPTAGTYGIAIKRASGPSTVDMHVYFGSPYSNYQLEHRTSSMSLGYPADDDNVLSVAAVNAAYPYSLESYSSAGPTAGPGGTIEGGRRKPDVAAYANVSTAAYASIKPFNGTSAAAPHVAGASLLVWSANPDWSAAQVRSFLEQRAIDMGSSGADNDYGWGRLWLGAPSATIPVPVASFTYSPTSPTAGQTVSFTDVSSGSPTSWLWSFGDGQSSTARNPTHVFTSRGVFNVSLTATNASGSNAKTASITVSSASAPVITYFGANPPAVDVGQQTTLTWTSTGGTSAAIDQGIGSVPTSGSKTIAPSIGVPYKLTVTGPGGSVSATVTVGVVGVSYAGTWVLPSSARVQGAGAFWTTDLTVMNTGSVPASVAIKLLGHAGNGANGPERSYTIPAKGTSTWPDVLSLMFGRESDYGPILIRSTATTIVAQGQTWTTSPTGGSYGQSVPAIGAAESVGATSRALAGLRQDSQFRTNIVLANMKESDAFVTLQVLLPDGTTATTYSTTLGALGFKQVNLANDLGVTNFVGGSVVVSSPTIGAQVAAYASVIDAATADPRTILAR